MKDRSAYCAVKDCGNHHSPRSNYCAPCRASLRRWYAMTETQKRASFTRAAVRWARVWVFRARRGRKRAA